MNLSHFAAGTMNENNYPYDFLKYSRLYTGFVSFDITFQFALASEMCPCIIWIPNIHDMWTIYWYSLEIFSLLVRLVFHKKWTYPYRHESTRTSYWTTRKAQLLYYQFLNSSYVLKSFFYLLQWLNGVACSPNVGSVFDPNSAYRCSRWQAPWKEISMGELLREPILSLLFSSFYLITSNVQFQLPCTDTIDLTQSDPTTTSG